MIMTVSITVKGKVQGVFFRQSTREKALTLGVTGLVRNEPDGSVYIIATGTQDQLDQLTAWCRRGPSRAVVTDVEVKLLDTKNFTGFTIDSRN